MTAACLDPMTLDAAQAAIVAESFYLTPEETRGLQGVPGRAY